MPLQWPVEALRIYSRLRRARFMGYVVSFTPRAADQPARTPVSEAAAIIIFPGVRYERVPDARPQQHGAAVAAKPRLPKH